MRGYRYVIEHTVTAADLDEMQHLNSATLVALLERARIAYMTNLTGNRDDAFKFILGELKVVFRSEGFEGETLEIGTRVATVYQNSFVYEALIMEKESQRIVATAGQVMVPFDHREHHSTSLPAWWLEKVEAFEGQRFRVTQ